MGYRRVGICHVIFQYILRNIKSPLRTPFRRGEFGKILQFFLVKLPHTALQLLFLRDVNKNAVKILFPCFFLKHLCLQGNPLYFPAFAYHPVVIIDCIPVRQSGPQLSPQGIHILRMDHREKTVSHSFKFFSGII